MGKNTYMDAYYILCILITCSVLKNELGDMRKSKTVSLLKWW